MYIYKHVFSRYAIVTFLGQEIGKDGRSKTRKAWKILYTKNY